jgi:adenylate cyclase
MVRISRDVLIGFLLAVLMAAGVTQTQLLRGADLALIDLESRWLRRMTTYAPPRDVVLIAIDERAYESIPEPYPLWQKPLGELFSGLAELRPAVVGLALPLPVRSYEFLAKGIDAPLISGIERLRATTPLVIGQGQGLGQQLRPVAPELLRAAGADRTASLVLCEDSDGVVRRIKQRNCLNDEAYTSFAYEVASQLGREASTSGMIDFSVGNSIDYLPLTTVLEWMRARNETKLRDMFASKVVVVASMLPTDIKYRLPVALSSQDPGNVFQHGAVAQVQALRSLLGRGMIEAMPTALTLLSAMLCALLWLGRNGWRKLVALAVVIGLILGTTSMALWRGYAMAPASLLAVTLIAFVARLAYESIRDHHEKQMLKAAFAGHVSPQVMRALLSGALQPDGAGDRCTITILFADIRGFTTRSSSATPEAMIELLNRFYGEAAAAIHGRGGAIDKYIGDGLMATFGVPQPLPAPERNALEAAQDLLVRIHRLNQTLTAAGQAPIEIGIGIHRGEVLAGYVGSKRRRDFTVIGDPVNTASRLEGLTKEVGYPVVCSHAVATAVNFSGGLVDLGDRPIKGRGELHVWGWNPPLAARLKQGVSQ